MALLKASVRVDATLERVYTDYHDAERPIVINGHFKANAVEARELAGALIRAAEGIEAIEGP